MPIEIRRNWKVIVEKKRGVSGAAIDTVAIGAAKRDVNKFSEACRVFDKEWGN